jgi:Uncharacterized protein conserved in cyanobacteria
VSPTTAEHPALPTFPFASGPVVLRLPPSLRFTRDQLFAVCQENRELRIEQNAQGDLIIMLPPGGETGGRNFDLTAQIAAWVRRDGTGGGFDSSTGFVLLNGATRSPDVAWVLRTRLASLTAAQKQAFLPLCPDFVLELRSPTDRLSTLQAKMAEYAANGARLGWLIDPSERKVHVYRPNADPQVLDDPSAVSGDPELPGLTLDLADIWNPPF